jgi:4-hydroxybenzoate polyprenyltransferase
MISNHMHSPTSASLPTRVRVLIAVTRPPVLALLALYAATGLAAAGGNTRSLTAVLPTFVVVAGFLIFSVSVNDLADVEIDRVNLATRRDRPLVTGSACRRELAVTAVVGALVALGAAASLGLAVLAVCGIGLVISAAYSLGPIRLAARGAVASMVLPACYVAVPYLTGALSTSTRVGSATLTLLAGLYVGFIGRILLKDFRDVRGDALFGKRTFLVRHGRRATCQFAAIGWLAGSALTVTAMSWRGNASVTLNAIYGAALAGVLVLLRALAVDHGPRRDELIISAIAIVGRGQLLTLLVTLSMTKHPELLSPVVAALAVVTAGQAYDMLRRGPVMRRTVPTAWIESGLNQSGRPLALLGGSMMNS